MATLFQASKYNRAGPAEGRKALWITLRMNGKFTYLALVLVAALSAAAGVLVFQSMGQREAPGEQPALLVLPEPREVPDFLLTDQFGQPFGPDRLRGRWSLMFFGFTHCPDV